MPTESEAEKINETKTWFLYMVRCHSGQLYTGITTDVARRFAAHEAGKGAKFLRGKGPLALQFQMQVGSHSEALKKEVQIKKLSKAAKEQFILEQSI
ncbi:GIY-YIG nuclease family protein [Mariprofundus sp. EBB-1]|uniref:GIY-YIG nuclease family protein n=1 Tax=Mariprofundus sp. EBB-1 TaxID=2650971 RepID=UPI000EF1795D|nr:GIY-YIG nuclease family protein [Mariprofundus sp. EBB-1]RLL51742.1 GIY-YIG nuclease family protein [Mariprofundus sp. EBB-1]